MLRALLTVSTACLLGGCMVPAMVATSVEKAGYSSDIDKGRAVLLHHVKTLQTAGDPLGDYFYALGNSDGWIKDVTEPKAITELFERAAAKGSMDAKILLALQVATSEPIPGQLDTIKGPKGKLDAWERGLAQLLPLLKQQCAVRRLVLDEGRPKVAYYAIAYDVWPEFRDGYYRNNADGSRTLLKDPARQQEWEALHRGCRTPRNEWLDLAGR